MVQKRDLKQQYNENKKMSKMASVWGKWQRGPLHVSQKKSYSSQNKRKYLLAVAFRWVWFDFT